MKAYITENNVVIKIGDNDELFSNCTSVEITEQEHVFIKNCKLPKRINGVFIDDYVEVIQVPLEIPRMKFKMQIRRSTHYTYEIIIAYIQNIPVSVSFTEEMKQDILDRLEDCVKFERYSPDFIMLANMMGVSDAKKDEIFIEGNKID